MLFGDLFFGLRQAGVPVSLSEWMALMELLSREGVQPNLADFYAAARAVLVKDESRFDLYDQVFSAVFGSGELPTAAAEQLLEWLANAKPPPELTPEEQVRADK